jgi:hypothetical protein
VTPGQTAKGEYQHTRDQEKLSDAMSGFTNDPLKAIERVARVDPSAADRLYNEYQTNMYHYGQLKSLDDNRQSEISNRSFDNRDKGVTRLSQWVMGGLPYDKIVKGAQMYGLSEDDLNSLGVTPDMTDEDRRAFAYGAMSINNQEHLPLDERKTSAAETSASARMISATRPRPGPRPRAQTDLEYYQAGCW